MNKTDTLARDWGYPDPLDLIEDYIFDGVMPGICRNDDCDYSTEVEPDADAAYCEACDSHTVQSMSIMMGII